MPIIDNGPLGALRVIAMNALQLIQDRELGWEDLLDIVAHDLEMIVDLTVQCLDEGYTFAA